MKRLSTAIIGISACVVTYCFLGDMLLAADSTAALTREQQATELLNAARAKLRDRSPDYKEALNLASKIIQDHPPTPAALSALGIKGEALINLNRHDEAYEAYTEMLNRAKSDTTYSHLARVAKRGCSYAILKRGQALLEESWIGGQKPPGALDKVRADCTRVIDMKCAAKHVARAKLMIAEVELLDRNPKKAESLAEKYLAEDFTEPKKLHQFAEQVLALHLVVAEAARRQGNGQKALQVNGLVKTLYSRLSQAEQDRLNVRRALERAYYQTMMAFVTSKADPSLIVAEAQEILKRNPHSSYAEYAKGVLASAASKPAP